MGERRPLLRLAGQHLHRLLHPGEPVGGEALDLQLGEHLQGAVLLGLPLEDPERQGAPQHLQDEPGQLLQLLDKHVWPQRHLLQLRHLPVWSPYQGDTISKAIVYNQGNAFSNNTYVGTWNFTVLDTGHLVSPSAWKAAPYNQDAGSTSTG